MFAEKLRWSRLTVISLVAAVSLIVPTAARAITFGDWATERGWTAGYVVPDAVHANYSLFNPPIDSLVGIGDYDWMTTPTTILHLDSNQITSIESGDFTGLGSLKSLILRFNRITSIESGGFTGLGSLETLALDHNQITSIESGDFTGLDSLKKLELYTNQITSIESGDFTGLEGLTHLDLTDNRISSIETGVFAGLQNLTRLYLDRNQITSIESGMFANLGSLTTLNLSRNQVTSVESGMFIGLGNLAILWLNDNQITSLESDIFASLGNLTKLYLGGNQITNIEAGTFAGLGKLAYLSMHGNSVLTNLNLEGANFASLSRIDLADDTSISRVSLKNARLTQNSLAALVSGGDQSSDTGIGELWGITELDLTGVDFSAITDLSPLWLMDRVTDLWLVDVLHLDANQLDTLLDNMAAMEDPNVEGTLYLTQADYNALNAAGGGKLARWDAETGHHVQIVPEPSAAVLLAAMLLFVACRGRIRGFARRG